MVCSWGGEQYIGRPSNRRVGYIQGRMAPPCRCPRGAAPEADAFLDHTSFRRNLRVNNCMTSIKQQLCPCNQQVGGLCPRPTTSSAAYDVTSKRQAIMVRKKSSIDHCCATKVAKVTSCEIVRKLINKHQSKTPKRTSTPRPSIRNY